MWPKVVPIREKLEGADRAYLLLNEIMALSRDWMLVLPGLEDIRVYG